MSTRVQYQYVELVGPVWTEPVADRLAWLPRGEGHVGGRPLPRPAPRDYTVLPPLDFKVWTVPRDNYRGRERPRPAPQDYTVGPVFVPPPPPYDPSELGWVPYVPRVWPRPQPTLRDYTVLPPLDFKLWAVPRDNYRGLARPRPVPRDYTVGPVFVPPYDPIELGWLAYTPRGIRALPRPPQLDLTVEPVLPPYDPSLLDWLAPTPRAWQRVRARPELTVLLPPQPVLDWLPTVLGYARTRPATRVSSLAWVPLGTPADVYDPSDLVWLPAALGYARARPTPRVSYLAWVPLVAPPAAYDPSDLAWLPAGSWFRARGLPWAQRPSFPDEALGPDVAVPVPLMALYIPTYRPRRRW